MLVNVVFDEEETDLDVIEIPESLVKDIGRIQQMFFEWLYDKKNNHGYLVRIDGFEGYSYATEEFVKWINDNLIDDNSEKAKIVCPHLTELSNDYPTIYF